MNQSPSPTTSTVAKTPSLGVRNLITFLLVIHFFALFVAIASNASFASIYTRLRMSVPGVLPYIQAMAFDQSYTISHHESDPQYIEAKLKFKDGSEQIIVIPPVEKQSGHRYMRLRNYCREFASNAREEDENRHDILSSALGGYFVQNYNAKGVEITCMEQRLTDEEMEELPEVLRDYQSIYNGVYVSFRGAAQILKSSPAGQVAPPINRKQTP